MQPLLGPLWRGRAQPRPLAGEEVSAPSTCALSALRYAAWRGAAAPDNTTKHVRVLL